MAGHNVAVLGATGSIGLATIDVVRALGAPWRVQAISAHRNADALARIASDTCPARAVISGRPPEVAPPKDRAADPAVAQRPKAVANWPRAVANWPKAVAQWPKETQVSWGPEALIAAALDPQVDVVVAAIVGRAGVESTLAALGAGKRVALANKETLVCAGPVVAELLCAGESSAEASSGLSARALAGPRLVPVDSEHSAIFQCLGAGPGKPRRLILTASGGPFRGWSPRQMQEATVDQALQHPTWKMGRKITIDSATMMNKALEIIEARWLFDVPADQLEVVVHPQSIIHSMVEFADGSVVAQMSPPDMRLPIQFALTYPERLGCSAPKLDRTKSWDLTLEPVDQECFPAIGLGFEVAAAGGTAGSVVNAANEAAVDLFLKAQIRFTDIVRATRSVLEHHTFEVRPSLERLLELDQWARAEVRRWSCRANS